MVKGYDPTTSDPSKILLEYLLRWSTKPNPLSLQQSEKYIKDWLKKSESTSQIYNRFKSLSQELRPQIILKKKCKGILNQSFLKLLFMKQNPSDKNYPAYSQNNKVFLCINMINNKTQLKENIDRQLMILWKIAHKKSKIQAESNKTKQKPAQINSFLQSKSLLEKIQQADKELMQSLFEGCKQGYKNYLLDHQVENRMSKKCAKYLFFRRCSRQLPLDAKFRYASKLIQEIF